MVSNIDATRMAQVQQISSEVKCEMRVIYADHRITLKFFPTTSRSEVFLKDFIPQFAYVIAQQLSSMFAITGEIIDVGKPQPSGQKKTLPEAKLPKDDSFNKLRSELRMQG